jgi:hypothetical protein
MVIGSEYDGSELLPLGFAVCWIILVFVLLQVSVFPVGCFGEPYGMLAKSLPMINILYHNKNKKFNLVKQWKRSFSLQNR